MKTTSSHRIYFSNLDGLRFILAMIVILAHTRFGEALRMICPFDFIDRIIQVFSTGGLAVSFFFVLSGFLITFLLIEEEERKGKIDIRKFYIRRILRIWPLFYLCVLFGFFVYPYIKMHLGYENLNPYNIFYHLTFLSNFDSIRVHNLGLVPVAPMMVGITWSISIEEQFYLVWPLLILVSRSGKFVFAILLAILLSTLFSIFIAKGIQLYYHSLSVLADFAIGGLFAYICFFRQRFQSFIQSLRKEVIICIYILGLLGLMYRYELTLNYAPGIERLLISLFFAFIIVEQNYAQHSFYKFGNWKRISSCGDYTYALYLLHPLGIQVSILLFRFMSIEWEDGFFFAFVYFAIAFVISFIISMLSYRYVESYFLSLRRKFY